MKLKFMKREKLVTLIQPKKIKENCTCFQDELSVAFSHEQFNWLRICSRFLKYLFYYLKSLSLISISFCCYELINKTHLYHILKQHSTQSHFIINMFFFYYHVLFIKKLKLINKFWVYILLRI